MPAELYRSSQMISVLDYRYFALYPRAIEKIGAYLSEDAFIDALLKVEVALVDVLARHGLCGPGVADEVRRAAGTVTAADVHGEQRRIRHLVMSLVNCLRARVSGSSKPFIHFTATTNDIVCSADAYRYKAFTDQALLPRLLELQTTLIELARREHDTLQIGRTHGQHAEPITFGFCLAQFVSRLGRMILRLKTASGDLRGKMAGPVGASNGAALFFDDPEAFEREVLAELGLDPSPISTQIVEAEFLVDYAHALVATFGVIANLADDMRQLHRSEIGEVEEHFGAEQVGSSTMPHKRNPSRFENIKSLWKVFMPRMATLYMDQISEHQRDLTNFESTQFVAEIAAGLYLATEMLDETMRTLNVRRDRMAQNFELSAGSIVAEPAHLLLSAQGHPDAHEALRLLSRQAREQGQDLYGLLQADPSLDRYLAGLSPQHVEVLRDAARYTGIAARKTLAVCAQWEETVKRLAVTPHAGPSQGRHGDRGQG